MKSNNVALFKTCRANTENVVDFPSSLVRCRAFLTFREDAWTYLGQEAEKLNM